MFGHASATSSKPLDPDWLASLDVDGLIVSSAEPGKFGPVTVFRYVPLSNCDPYVLPRDAKFIAGKRNVVHRLVFDQHPNTVREYKILAAVQATVPPARR